MSFISVSIFALILLILSIIVLAESPFINRSTSALLWEGNLHTLSVKSLSIAYSFFLIHHCDPIQSSKLTTD